MKILYGLSQHESIDVTKICVSKLNNNSIITIPSGDANRASHFTDPFYGSLKKIIIIDNNQVYEFEYYKTVVINLTTKSFNYIITGSNEVDEKINRLHSNIRIKYGSLQEELPEQKMAVKYLTGTEKVLEIGGNVGRNSLLIASILSDSSNLVTLESDPDISLQLTENRDLNVLSFHIETSALSNRKLIQSGWNTIPSDNLLDGYKWVNTITLEELKNKYNIQFDTLVLDCEGAFYYILMDMPEILDNINLIIMENDYTDITHKNYIDNVLRNNKFYVDYQERGGWGPCEPMFFEVWKKHQ